MRLAALVALRHSPIVGERWAEQTTLRAWAMRMASGDLQDYGAFGEGPLYPTLLGYCFRLFGSGDLAPLLFQALAGVVTCALVLVCARRYMGERAALGAALFCALCAPLVFAELRLSGAWLSPLLLLSALYGAQRGAEGAEAGWFAWSGVATGLAFLVRESHALWLVPLALAARAMPARSQASSAPRGFALAALCCAFLALALPQTLHHYRAAESVSTLSPGLGEDLYIGLGPGATGYPRETEFRGRAATNVSGFREEAILREGREVGGLASSLYWGEEALREVAARPVRALRVTLAKLSGVWNDFDAWQQPSATVLREMVPLLAWLPGFAWISGLGAVGLVFAWRDRRRFTLPLGLLAVGIAVPLVTFHSAPARAAWLPLWAIFAAHGASKLWRARPGAGRSSTEPGAARFGLALAAAAVLTLLALLPPFDFSRSEAAYRDAAVLAHLVAQQGPGADSESETRLREALALAPEREVPRARRALARHLAAAGHSEEAFALFEESLRAEPDNVPARIGLARLALARGDATACIAQLDAILAMHPKGVPHDLASDLAWRLATHPDPAMRDGEEAVRWGVYANENARQPYPRHLDALAAAFAEAGDFPEALRIGDLAAGIARGSGEDALRERIEERLAGYRAGRPHRGAR